MLSTTSPVYKLPSVPIEIGQPGYPKLDTSPIKSVVTQPMTFSERDITLPADSTEGQPTQLDNTTSPLKTTTTLPTTSTESDFTLHVSIGGESTCSSELANSPPGNPPESINTQPEISLETIGCQPTPSPLVNALSKASLKITGGQPTASPEPEELAGGKRYLTRSQGAAPSFIKKNCKGSTMYPLQ